MNVPNSLTVLRLLLAPAIMWLIVTGSVPAAAILFAVAAFTDAADGWAARTWKQTTTFGQFADPVADKVLLSGTFLAFGIQGAVPSWLVMVVFGRDLYLVLATIISMEFAGLREYQPTIAGKLNTATQILYVVALLGSEALDNPNLHKLSDLLVWPIAFLAVFTGVHYTLRGILHLARD
jgi:cardiolipin synthase